MAVGRRLCGLAVAESHAQGGALLAKELGKLSVGELDAIQLAARLQRLVLRVRRFGACIGDEAVAELHAQPQHGQLLVRLRLVLLDLDGVVKRARLHGRERRRGGDVRRRVRQVERHTEACERHLVDDVRDLDGVAGPQADIVGGPHLLVAADEQALDERHLVEGLEEGDGGGRHMEDRSVLVRLSTMGFVACDLVPPDEMDPACPRLRGADNLYRSGSGMFQIGTFWHTSESLSFRHTSKQFSDLPRLRATSRVVGQSVGTFSHEPELQSRV